MNNKDPVKISVEQGNSNSKKLYSNHRLDEQGETRDISLRIAILYSIVGALWILFSDKILESFSSDTEIITFLSVIKGWIYAAVTSAIIYRLLSYYMKKIRRIEKELIGSDIRLSLADKDLELVRKHFNSILNDKINLRQEHLSNLEQLNKMEEIHYAILDTTSEVIWEEVDGHTYFSDRWYEITGYSQEEFNKIDFWEYLIHPSDKFKVISAMKEHEGGRTPYFNCEFRVKAKNGQYKWLKARGKFLFDAQGQVYRKIGVYTDISEMKDYEVKLYNFACYDQLTGMQNRAALNETLHSMIYKKNNLKFALLFINIDNFKYINDTMGHTFGDNLLLKVSERLNGIYAKEANLFRIGGDEFVILIKHFSQKEEIERRAVDIIRTFKTQFEVSQNTVYITASIGVSLYPEHGEDVDTLLKSADIAVHKAKETGKNRIVFYNEPMNEIIAERMYIEKYLWSALMNNEFELYYQPQLELETNRITGFEALIRWNNAELGVVSPAKFISIAEETCQIIQIGAWVFKTACEFLKRLHWLGHEDLNISVNISIVQLLQDDFADMIIDTIEEIGLNAKQVELEITESILMESYEKIEGKLKLLRSRGIKMALDDFGKGYSSLNYLKQLPITTLKIDKTFIDTIACNEKNKSLTDLIVNMGRSMDLIVVAEGVETKEQMDYLVRHRCNKIQGYYFSKPLPENEVINNIDDLWSFQNLINT